MEESRAECPFRVTLVPDLPHAKRQKHKKQKQNGLKDDMRVQTQVCPFVPRGSFKTNKTLDVGYTVEPKEQWFNMTRYNSFILNNFKYYIGDFVSVANDATVKLQEATMNKEVTGQFQKGKDDWVARILEIRAVDMHHVYARINWMYSPDELPKGTLDSNRLV
ncbi:hypothetical protein B0I35DRAFT_471909 [Stachybotrys elegans]|uniref:BAH domain-containing protein n=1 Tax=Stachybotrys elegans TaxID=80388 RepID=A0A8K0SJ62_9HYPO|nr:hypothetical protein B0I35DRAFT_471909 [Stachybotrys elegans]